MNSHPVSSRSDAYSSAVIDRFAYWQEMMNMPRRTFVARLDEYKIPRPKKDV